MNKESVICSIIVRNYELNLQIDKMRLVYDLPSWLNMQRPLFCNMPKSGKDKERAHIHAPLIYLDYTPLNVGRLFPYKDYRMTIE